jgi:hypothetical protein
MQSEAKQKLEEQSAMLADALRQEAPLQSFALLGVVHSNVSHTAALSDDTSHRTTNR